MRQYALSVLLAASGTEKVTVLTEHALVPMWAVVLVYVALLAVLITAIVLISRAATRMTKPGRIIVGIVAVWTIFAAIAVFIASRPTGDWVGGFVESGFVVVYGVVAAAIVLAIDKVVRLFRAASLRARPSS
jgi:hypothetical protein